MLYKIIPFKEAIVKMKESSKMWFDKSKEQTQFINPYFEVSCIVNPETLCIYAFHASTNRIARLTNLCNRLLSWSFHPKGLMFHSLKEEDFNKDEGYYYFDCISDAHKHIDRVKRIKQAKTCEEFIKGLNCNLFFLKDAKHIINQSINELQASYWERNAMYWPEFDSKAQIYIVNNVASDKIYTVHSKLKFWISIKKNPARLLLEGTKEDSSELERLPDEWILFPNYAAAYAFVQESINKKDAKLLSVEDKFKEILECAKEDEGETIHIGVSYKEARNFLRKEGNYACLLTEPSFYITYNEGKYYKHNKHEDPEEWFPVSIDKYSLWNVYPDVLSLLKHLKWNIPSELYMNETAVAQNQIVEEVERESIFSANDTENLENVKIECNSIKSAMAFLEQGYEVKLYSIRKLGKILNAVYKSNYVESDFSRLNESLVRTKDGSLLVPFDRRNIYDKIEFMGLCITYDILNDKTILYLTEYESSEHRNNIYNQITNE